MWWNHRTCTKLLTPVSPFCSVLHARLRTATLRHDEEGQAVLLNLLLRNYLHYNLFDQADKFIAKSKFPETASNNEGARYLYYTGRIKAIQLEYSEAYTCLLQAIRKAPQDSAVGFLQTVRMRKTKRDIDLDSKRLCSNDIG